MLRSSPFWTQGRMATTETPTEKNKLKEMKILFRVQLSSCGSKSYDDTPATMK